MQVANLAMQRISKTKASYFKLFAARQRIRIPLSNNSQSCNRQATGWSVVIGKLLSMKGDPNVGGYADHLSYVKLDSAKYVQDTLREEQARYRRYRKQQARDTLRLFFLGLAAMGVTYVAVFNYAFWAPALQEYLGRYF